MDLHRLRLACMIGLPVLLVISFVIKTLFAAPNDTWAFAFFTISLTANIGYFTNFIAIKMLFRPYQKTALGRQGLIPKNQSKLASALSTTLTEHFLQHDHLVDYLRSSNVLPQLVKSLEQTTSEWLASNQNQRVKQSFLIKLIREYQPEIEHWINQQQNAILERFSEQVDLNELANDGFQWLDKAFKDNPRQMEFLIEPLVNTIAGNIPIIAARLLDLVDDHIEQQSTIKRGVAKAAKWSANLSEEDIKNYLFKMVASQTFRQTLIEGLQSLVADYQKLSNENSELAIAMERFSQKIKQSLSKKLNDIQLIDQIVGYVENPKFASLLGNASIKISSLVFNKLKHYATTPEAQETIYSLFGQITEQINLKSMIKEKAKQFSPKTIESLFNQMIADQLIFIELLGAILGALSGLALININYLLIVTFAGFSYFAIDTLLTKQGIKNRIKDRHKSDIKPTF